MTVPNHIMLHPYVVAHQASVKHDIRNARLGDSRLGVAYQRGAAWLVKTRGRFRTMTRSTPKPKEVRSFDRSSATGSCEIENGLTA